MPKPYYESEGVSIFCGDAREVLPQLSPSDFGVCVTDPPFGIEWTPSYAVNGMQASWAETSIAGDASTEVRDFALTWASGLPMAVFGSWKATRPEKTREILIWDKGPQTGMGDLSFPWKRSYEEIYIIGDGWSGRRDEGVIRGHVMPTWESRGRIHPNQKPETLIQHLLGKAPDGAVIDPFCGVGTTLVAAKLCGRHAVGIEIKERYCALAAERLSQRVLWGVEASA